MFESLFHSFFYLVANFENSMFRYSLLISSAILLFFNTILFSQTKGINRDKYRINISHSKSIINIDGILDEPVWATADKANHFQRVQPTDTGFAIAQTEVR